MTYWLNLFTGRTWQEFQDAGAKVSGFRAHQRARAAKVRPGDLFLCYLVGVSRWVGVLEVIGEMYEDEKPIYSEEVFPVRFAVKPRVLLRPETGVPMEALRGTLSFFPREMMNNAWTGRVRGSPQKYKDADGEAIAAAIRAAQQNPVEREVDPKRLNRPANLYQIKGSSTDENADARTVVTVPPASHDESADEFPTDAGPSHTEMQWRLLDLGARMGLNVWAPKPDRGRAWPKGRVGEVPRMLDQLPTQFDEATNKTIGNIDVLWFNDQMITAAFEVEHSTSIYSGLLRMSDLLTMHPNLDLRFYLVAPDERLLKFQNEVARPTFAKLKKPLHTLCRFLPYTQLCASLDRFADVYEFLKPEFLDKLAEQYDPADDV